MTVDEMILKALEDGPVTVNDITADIANQFISRVRIKLEKLRVRGVVIREGRGGAHRAFTYQLIRPDCAAQAIAEKGGGLARRQNDARTAAPKRGRLATTALFIDQASRPLFDGQGP